MFNKLIATVFVLNMTSTLIHAAIVDVYDVNFEIDKLYVRLAKNNDKKLAIR